MKKESRMGLLLASGISLGLAIASIFTAIFAHDISSIYYGWIGLATLLVGCLIQWALYQDDKVEGE